MNQPLRHALIIEDQRTNVDVLSILLAREGFTCSVITQPAELESKLDQFPDVEVIFLDLEFPNHTGYELFHKLRAHPRFAHPPIVAYSVHTSAFHQAREVGFHSFIGKPLQITRFHDQIEKILSGTPVWEIYTG